MSTVETKADAASNATKDHKGSWLSSVNDKGEYVRKASVFRNWIQADPAAEFAGESGRYHIYVSYACPWAHRTLITRAIKGLQSHISVDVVDWFLGDGGWRFASPDDVPGATPDTVHGRAWMREVYKAADPEYSGNITVPCLFDKKKDTIVNNESSEIIRMLSSAFNDVAAHPEIDLYPESLRAEIDEINDFVYPRINNGVYKCGFAQTQEAYEKAFDDLFEALDTVEARLAKSRFLVGNRFTEADVRLFTTLIRFDAVYVQHFKCNGRRIQDYPNLHNYTKDIFALPGVAETCDFTHIKWHYCNSHRSINPLGIVPKGPVLDFSSPHDRDRFGPIEGLPGLVA